ncbi:MAG: hypothetical protein IPH35_24345 [Rhodoferax sp.]|nr:hypothetical protein [Rhodoferax sp.]
MKSKLGLLGLCVFLVCATPQAHAIGRMADVTLLDRDSGSALRVYYHHGEYWVAGRPGARYAISVRNTMGERLMAVTSVDGINVLTGETAAWSQTGYVFSPYLQYQITGWRKSNNEVAAFEFSAAPDSYAERTGRPTQVGVIGVALFREYPTQPVMQPEVSRRGDFDSGLPSIRAKREVGPASPSAAPAGPENSSGSLSGMAERGSSETLEDGQRNSAPSIARQGLTKTMPAPLPSPKLGTGHGQREESVVAQTSFARLQSTPNEVIRIRYDSRDNLIASGVIREPVRRAPTPNPFPESDSTSYVPDPPARRY